MKKSIIIILMLPFIATVASAQIRRTPVDSLQTNSPINHSKMSKKVMMDKLNLTKEQRGQMKQIHQSAKAQKEAIESDTTLSPAQKQQKLKELHKQTEKSAGSILTDDQKMKMKEMRREKRNGKMNGQQRPNMPAKDSTGNDIPYGN